jgi:hypothetical protein
MDKNKLEQSPLHKEIEIIPTNSSNSTSASKWTTDIYVPVRPKKPTFKVSGVKKDSLNTANSTSVRTEKTP